MGESLKVVWDGSLDTGVKLVDVQHKYLIDIINELAEAIEEGKASTKVGEILNLLQYYAEWHFEREEMCMHKYECPAAEANESAHKKFIETFKAFRAEYRSSGGSEEIARGMYSELVDWLVRHIQRIDMKLESCVHDHQ